MTEPERTPQTAPDLETLREHEYAMYRRVGERFPEGTIKQVDDYRAAVEARVRAEERATGAAGEMARYYQREFLAAESERDAARAEVERLREAALELADAYDQWDQSACTFLHKHPHEPSDLVQAVRRAALSTEAAQ